MSNFFYFTPHPISFAAAQLIDLSLKGRGNMLPLPLRERVTFERQRERRVRGQ